MLRAGILFSRDPLTGVGIAMIYCCRFDDHTHSSGVRALDEKILDLNISGSKKPGIGQ